MTVIQFTRNGKRKKEEVGIKEHVTSSKCVLSNLHWVFTK